MARSMPPKAFWPLVVTAGVNDYLDFTINGGSEMSARIAAGVYLSIASLLTACETAMEAEDPGVTITAGVNDKVDFFVSGVAYTATIPAGSYSDPGASQLAVAVSAAIYAECGVDTFVLTGGEPTSPRISIMIDVAAPWELRFLSGPNNATTAALALGFTKTDKTGATSYVAENTVPGYVSWTATASTTGRVTLASDVSTSLKLSTGTHAATSARDVLGFGAVDTAAGTSHVGTLQHANGWYPEKPCTFDSREEYERTTAGSVSLAGQVKLLTFGSAREIRRVTFAWLPEWKTKIDREGTHTNEALERLWLSGFAKFRYWPDATVEGTYFDASLDAPLLKSFAPSRDDRMQLYGYTLVMRTWVA